MAAGSGTAHIHAEAVTDESRVLSNPMTAIY